MNHGMINVYKEKGFTSHDVVAKLRGICKQKKIGHTGTLDPEAVGVLPVCLGNATKLCDMLTDKEKEYIADFMLGCVTDTQDISGVVLKESKVDVTTEQVREAVPHLSVLTISSRSKKMPLLSPDKSMPVFSRMPNFSMYS